MNFSEYILQNRSKRKMTQTELAKIIGVSNTAVSNYEKGISYPHFKVLLKLFKVFNTPLNNIGVVQSNVLDALSENTGGLSQIRVVEADAGLACEEIRENEFFFIQHVQGKIQNGALVYCEHADKKGIYKLYHHIEGFILMPHSRGAIAPIRIDSVPQNVYEIKSILKFLP